MEKTTSTPSPFGDSSYDTAVCLLPPMHMWKPIDHLRFLNDKAFGKWPPHVNIMYPFVRPEVLSEAATVLSGLDWDNEQPLGQLSLQEVGTFSHKKSNTIFLRPSKGEKAAGLTKAFNRLRDALGRPADPEDQPHLTIAQSEGTATELHQSLVAKARLLCPLTWSPAQLTILQRVVDTNGDGGTGRMRVWGTISLKDGTVDVWQSTTEPYDQARLQNRPSQPIINLSGVAEAGFRYLSSSQGWGQQVQDHVFPKESVKTLVLASYNVSEESKPASNAQRFPYLVHIIKSQRATADILILQEVDDEFLDYILSDRTICTAYPFATHGQPTHPQTGPLPGLRNSVVLSRFPMKVQYLIHQKKARHSMIVEFPSVHLYETGEQDSASLMLAVCHLSPGLKDEDVAANHDELQELVVHLTENCTKHLCLLAGGLNLTTSSFTIDAALADGTLSREAEKKLRDIQTMLVEKGFQDAWLRTRIQAGESSSAIHLPHDLIQLNEGEQGATFDPRTVAQAVCYATNEWNHRPQRYSRILVGPRGGFLPKGFNIFGHEPFDGESQQARAYSSAHAGIRCLLQSSDPTQSSQLTISGDFQVCRASMSLGSSQELRHRLSAAHQLPDRADEVARMEAVLKLREILIDGISSPSNVRQTFKPSFVLLTVGSVGLGVWTESSNINCLAIGGIASKTFFVLAARRLMKASAEGITLLQRSRTEAGTMLLLLVQGFRVELQYCPSILMAERCPEVLSRPPSDPVFTIPNQTLLKLKPARDLAYLRRSIPDLAQYRLAHLLIRAWATLRGLYAPEFGYLNAMHISALLVPVCKLIASTGVSHTVADIVVTFFRRYASFDWEQQNVFDPFFHKDTKYHRSFREPLCLLGWHAPALNTASTATSSVVKVLAQEMNRADALMSHSRSTWDDILSKDLGNTDFLRAYTLYIKMEIRYWTSFDTRRARFLSWLKSRCCGLLNDLDRKSPMVTSRIWPERFIHDKANVTPTTSPQEYHGCYLIGLQPIAGNTKQSISKAAKESAQVELTKVLSDFEIRIRADDAYYDSRSCWVSLTLVDGSELGSLKPEPGSLDVGLDAYDQCADTSDLEDDFLSDEKGIMSDDGFEQDQTQENPLPTATSPRSKTVSRMGHDFNDASVVTGGPVLGKFRTAIDVINRLKWDESMDSSDFVVGYEDRFVGPQEKALAMWKGDPTHEEFIPQHRILYFKRRSDGAKVWERSTRMDKVFGSGARN